MQRFSWPYYIAAVAAVFLAGVFCGTRWERMAPTTTQSALIAEQSSSHADKPADSAKTAPSQQAEAASVASSDKNNTPQTQASSATPPAAETTLAQASSGESQAPSPAGSSSEPTKPSSNPAASSSDSTSAGTTVAYIPNAVQSLTHQTAIPFAPSTKSFSLQKLGTGQGPTLLVIGGIQGDEPGGFSAAALLATHYKITSGNVWVVPDLNFLSILTRNRGNSGDMNRKFAEIDPKDPDYDIVMQVKSVLLDENVSLVLNLHDGSGFYRPTWEDALRNPKRWGQSVIIDQEEVEAPRFNQLYATARHIEEEVNKALINPGHRYHTHNTNTAAGDREMEKTLSYFAVCNGKPAFGIEASKEFSTEYRAYYHLNVIEAFMRNMGVKFTRDFALSPKGVLAALNSNLKMTAYNSRLVLDLDNVRPTLTRIPFKKGASPDLRTSKPLLALMPEKGKSEWRIAYGNRTLTRIKPEFMDFDESLTNITMDIDGTPHNVSVGDMVFVKESFKVKGISGYRVNAIGAQKEKNGTEADILIRKKDFIASYSLDKSAKTYRVELYKGKAFAGMVLVHFGEPTPIVDNMPLTATKGPESELGM